MRPKNFNDLFALISVPLLLGFIAFMLLTHQEREFVMFLAGALVAKIGDIYQFYYRKRAEEPSPPAEA